MSWENKKFIEFILLQRGHDLTKKQIKPGIFPVVTSTSIMGYHNEYKAEGPGVITGRSGTIGEVQYVEENYWPHNTSLFVKDFKGNYPRYVYYFMKHFGTARAKSGSAVPTLNRNNLNDIEISVPDVDTQVRIANILSAYDSLIENNQKQIKLLEEAAQRLYKEWFVDLRFPGHEDVAIVDGVPEGWKREKLIDIANVQYGYSFDGSQFNSNGIGMPIIRIRNIPSGITSDYTTEEANEQYIVSNGDIIVGMDGEFHINSWNGDSAYLVQRTCKFTPRKELMKGWLLQAIYEPIKFFEKTVVGATVAHLGKKHIDTIELLTGPDELYVPFKALFDKRQLLLNQNILLAEARDRLLPKLMSGEIEV